MRKQLKYFKHILIHTSKRDIQINHTLLKEHENQYPYTDL